MDDERAFGAGTLARCNRCQEKHPLPKLVRAVRENRSAYRIQDFARLDCGHMDCHWVFLSDNPGLGGDDANPA